MVAITVILAAVIGTFVLGLGDSLGDSQPTAQLEVSLDETNDVINLEHKGGDPIPSDSIRVVVTSNSDEGNGTISDRLSVGDTLTSAGSSGNTASSGDVVRIRLIHQPSDSILLDQEIEVVDEFVYGDSISFS